MPAHPRPIVAGVCRSVTGGRHPEIIGAVRRKAARAALTMMTVAALTTGCSAVLDQVAVVTGSGPAVVAPGEAATDGAASGDAAAALATLPVKGRAPKTGYDRDNFGPSWADVDRNGCDTRNDILKRDLDGETFKPRTRDCVVLTGTLNDPYTGKTISFTRGQGSSEAVQIDHVVALSDAWQKGAQQLSADTRRSLSNDPLNLMAVDGPTNQGKGDGDAATWLPPRKAFRCEYVAIQIAVKQRYGLWITAAERDAMARVLVSCPQQPLPAG